MFTRIKAFIIRDIKLVFRDKASVFWLFAWPILWILLTAYVFVPPGVGSPITLDVGVVNYDSSTTEFNGTTLVEIMEDIELNGTRIFNVKEVDNETILLNYVRKGDLDVGIIIPENFGKNVTMGQAILYIYINAKDLYSSQMRSAIMKSFFNELNKRIAYTKINYTMYYIEKYSKYMTWGNVSNTQFFNESFNFVEFLREYFKGIAEPINATFKEIKPKTLMDRSSIIGWYTVGAIGMMFLYGGFSWGATIIVEERERGTLKKLLSTPLSIKELFIGRILSGIVVLGIASIVAIFVGLFVCRAKIVWNPLIPVHWLVPVLIVMAALMSIGIGIIISIIAKSLKGATDLAVILGLMLAFLAGIWFPREWMPPALQLLAEVFPITWAIDAIRSIIVYEAGPGEILLNVVRVFLATLVIYAIDYIVYKTFLRKYVEF